MKKQIFLSLATSLAVALGLSATGNQVDSIYNDSHFVVQDSIGEKKTDADSLPVPAPGRAPGKVDSTPFRDEPPRPVDPTPSPRPTDPPMPQPVKPASADHQNP